jgi:hypothetical protein
VQRYSDLLAAIEFSEFARNGVPPASSQCMWAH